MESIRRALVRLRIFFAPPKKEVQSWVVDDAPAPPVEEERASLWVYVDGFKALWVRVRTRLFRVAAGILALVNLALAVVLYSNIWYMNLILWAVTVPQFLILIHYLRLTRNG